MLIIQDIGIINDIYVSLFAIFDGHGGKDCSKFLKEKFADILKNSFLFYFP
jgi:serine/threonine protein phosphatase PrpC